jgi:uncharacterized SAM-binding protein YcdF (DUF218 family)
MTLFLSKLAPVFIYPLGAAFVAIVLGLISLWVGWRRTSTILLASAIIALWTASSPLFATWLVRTLESQHPPVAIAALPPADVAIVLAGFAAPALSPRVSLEVSCAVDRALEGAPIYHAGKVSYLLISGGNLPWQQDAAPEAELIAQFMGELGVPREAMVVETTSRNTRENAVNSAAVLTARGWTTAILVTSGAHMPRAKAAFDRVGIATSAASADIQAAGPASVTVFDVLPDAGALANTTPSIKEWLGLLAYRLQGWA